MKKIISLIVAFCMVLLAAAPISASEQNSLSSATQLQASDAQPQYTYYDIADIPDNIRMLLKDHGTIDEDYQLVKSQSSENEKSNKDSIYSLQLQKRDGSGIATVYSVPVKYIDDNGKIQLVDTSLKSAAKADVSQGYEYRNAANTFTIAFSTAAEKGIKVNSDFTMAIAGSLSTTQKRGVADKLETGAGRIAYPEAFGPATTVEYINTAYISYTHVS